MNRKVSKWLLVFLFAINCLAIMQPAEAFVVSNGYYHSGYHYGYYHGYYNRHHCKWVAGYSSRGYWHAAHRVCYVR